VTHFALLPHSTNDVKSDNPQKYFPAIGTFGVARAEQRIYQSGVDDTIAFARMNFPSQSGGNRYRFFSKVVHLLAIFI
jgi:hypothetical protein